VSPQSPYFANIDLLLAADCIPFAIYLLKKGYCYELIELYKEKLFCVIKGLDSIRFRGTLRWIANDTGIRAFLKKNYILLRDFSQWANNLTTSIQKNCEEQASKLGIETQI